MSRSFKVLSLSWLVLCVTSLFFSGQSAVVAGAATPAATATASPEANKQIIIQYYAAYNKNVTTGKADFFDQFLAANYVDHQSPPDAQGVQVVKDGYLSGLKIFPDAHIDSYDLIAEGDEVVDRNTFYGTQKGPLGGIPASNKLVVSNGMDIYRLADGKVVEHWGQNDDLALMQQLGVMPGSAPAPSATREPTATSARTKSGSAATVEANKALVRSVYDAFNSNSLDKIDPLLAAKFIDHNPTSSADGLKQFLAALKTAFPDMTISIDDMIAEGDEVAVRLTASGTQQAPYDNMLTTGSAVKLAAINIFRITNGAIVEEWHIEDQLGLIQQLTPPQPPPTEAATQTPTQAATQAS